MSSAVGNTAADESDGAMTIRRCAKSTGTTNSSSRSAAELADPLLAELLRPRRLAPRRQARPRWACSPRRWSRRWPRTAHGWRFAGCAAVALERMGDIEAAEQRAARGRVDGPGLAAAVVRPGPLRLRSRRRRARVGVAASRRRRAGSSVGADTGAASARSRAPTSAATSRAGAGPAASTRNAISGTSSCRWPSGWAGCT